MDVIQESETRGNVNVRHYEPVGGDAIYTLYLPNDLSPVVTVRQASYAYGQMVYQTPEINWSACGAQGAAYTAQMVEALQVALEIAAELDKRTGQPVAQEAA